MPTLPTELTHPESPDDGLAAVVALRRLADRMEDAEVERALRDAERLGGCRRSKTRGLLGALERAARVDGDDVAVARQ